MPRSGRREDHARVRQSPQWAAAPTVARCGGGRTGDRYFLIALDEAARTIQVIHPANVPSAVAVVLPTLPASVARAGIQAILDMRLPE